MESEKMGTWRVQVGEVEKWKKMQIHQITRFLQVPEWHFTRSVPATIRTVRRPSTTMYQHVHHVTCLNIQLGKTILYDEEDDYFRA